MSPNEIFTLLSLLIVNLYLKSFASILFYFYMCGSWSVFRRIQKAPKYGFNMDPDPKNWIYTTVLQYTQSRIQRTIICFYLSALSYFAGSGVRTIIPDPDPGPSSGSMRIRIHNTPIWSSTKYCLYKKSKKVTMSCVGPF